MTNLSGPLGRLERFGAGLASLLAAAHPPARSSRLRWRPISLQCAAHRRRQQCAVAVLMTEAQPLKARQVGGRVVHGDWPQVVEAHEVERPEVVRLPVRASVAPDEAAQEDLHARLAYGDDVQAARCSTASVRIAVIALNWPARPEPPEFQSASRSGEPLPSRSPTRTPKYGLDTCSTTADARVVTSFVAALRSRTVHVETGCVPSGPAATQPITARSRVPGSAYTIAIASHDSPTSPIHGGRPPDREMPSSPAHGERSACSSAFVAAASRAIRAAIWSTGSPDDPETTSAWFRVVHWTTAAEPSSLSAGIAGRRSSGSGSGGSDSASHVYGLGTPALGAAAGFPVAWGSDQPEPVAIRLTVASAIPVRKEPCIGLGSAGTLLAMQDFHEPGVSRVSVQCSDFVAHAPRYRPFPGMLRAPADVETSALAGSPA